MKVNLCFYKILFVLLLFSSTTFSQQQDFIEGKLIDQQTNEPVIFASVRIKGRALGVITNADGGFRIPSVLKQYGNIIEFSSMGYQTKEISIADLNQDQLNLISLAPGVISLQETVVTAKNKNRRKLNASQIVQRAIDAIPNNFASTSFSTVGYYRDYQFKDDEYINLNEAILEVFDQGIDQLDDSTSEISIFNFDLNTDFKQDSMARSAYDYDSNRKIIKKAYLDIDGGNEFRILRVHDAIRNYNVDSYDFIGTLKTNFVKNHFFLRSSDTSKDNEELYTITFKVFHPNYRANGTIYISKWDYSIHKLEYTMYDEKRWNETRKKNKHGHKQKVIFDITTDYRRINDKMYLNYISFNNSFTLYIPPVFTTDYISVDMKRRCFAIEYNNLPEFKSANHLPNYDVKFQNKRVKLERAERLQNIVFLYPKMEEEEISGMLSEIVEEAKKGENLNELLDIRIENVRDTLGNLINQWTEEQYFQFREYFVQRVKPDSRAPFDNSFMDKSKPIFTDQPIIKPKDYKEYWMNTPLQNHVN
ncbi:carboxypeptidase-like regulatory domain-containing protein [Eudoraea chungangensis]|uniref:carboxypeptidase-like regulatory domain-containing protein n=1 Tax=Eudoraea chungangensis TaxID=1481905 RepID=UPI0023ECCAE1|nr:carboxypeptidase-like regulatory domain-containing protein [Eudoraea chungangensis]